MPFLSAQTTSSQTSETLAALLAQVAQGDRHAFSELYKATNLKLFGVALRILRRKDIAEDILHDVYIKVWEKAVDYDASRGSAVTWMTTIARNRALDEVRRVSQLVSSEDVAGFEDLPDASLLVSETLERTSESIRLKGCLETIEEEKRRMVLLAYHYGLSRERLAEQFGHPVATIKTWLRRSLESLKYCLQQ